MISQKLIMSNIYQEYRKILRELDKSKVFIVCGKSVSKNLIAQMFLNDSNTQVVFQDFEPNPSYESVIQGVRRYRENFCDCILAIGGGSAMDVAKCIKAYVSTQNIDNISINNVVENDIPFFAIPTTAGTGSEATKFAVIYYLGEKQSVEHDSLIPTVVFFESNFLVELPLYQKKVTMLDALCHGIESYWSINATTESRAYAQEAMQLILDNYKLYLQNHVEAILCMQKAAHLAGKAINISKTTAAHAMCYKLTSLYDLPHGLAAAVCLEYVWKESLSLAMINRERELQNTLRSLADIFGAKSESMAITIFCDLVKELDLKVNLAGNKETLEILLHSVNSDRLKNHPIKLTESSLRNIYTNIINFTER